MHVTSNPFFAFHDDIFPAFAKNAASQRQFPQPSPFLKTIIPDNSFYSLEELKHISTLEMKLNGTEHFELDLDFRPIFAFPSELKILEFQLFDGTSLLKLGISEKGSPWIASDYSNDRVILQLLFSDLQKLRLNFSSNNQSCSLFVEVFENGEREIKRIIKLSGLESIENRRVRIFKFDSSTSIRNFIYSSAKSSQINVIRPWPWFDSDYRPYALMLDGSIKENAFFNPPFGSKMSICEYAQDFKHALVKNQLHLFGGRNNKIARLDGCQFTELSAQFYYLYTGYSSVLSISGGSEAIICFDGDSERKCELFDGFKVRVTFATTSPHQSGELALYNGRPTAIGGGLPYGVAKAAVETLTNSGWVFLQNHPRWISLFSAIGLPSGSVLTVGGLNQRNPTGRNGEFDDIWQLKENHWSLVGSLEKSVLGSSALLFDKFIYVFPGSYDKAEGVFGPSPIIRISLDSEEKVLSTDEVAVQKDSVYFPILFVTPSEF